MIWKNLPYWVRGAIIGLAVGLLIVFGKVFLIIIGGGLIGWIYGEIVKKHPEPIDLPKK